MLFRSVSQSRYYVLVEGLDKNRGNLYGRSSQNKTVFFLGDKALIGQVVKVKILQAFSATMRGELVGSDTQKSGELVP